MRGALLLALVALPLAAGQPPPQLDACRAPLITVQDVTGPFQPGSSTVLQFGIENPNGPSVDAVRATVTTSAPAGWAVTPAQRELTMPPHDVEFTALAVTAPNRGSGQPAGNITLLVTFVCTNGEIQTSASASAVVEVELRALSVPWPLVLGGFLVLAAGVTALGVRRLRRGVAMWARTPERTVEPGKSAKFTVMVENRRGKPQRFTFLAAGVPEGWSAHLALDEVELEPGEEKALWAILKAPPTAVPGTEADVALRLESPRGAREGATARVLAKVVEPER